jgi:hypothetical protein
VSREIQLVILDDITREPADEAVTIGLNGEWWELDLTTAHADDLRETLGQWTRRGRQTDGVPTPLPGPVSDNPVTARRDYFRRMRTWGNDNGFRTVKKGATGYYISRALKVAYAAANPWDTEPSKADYPGSK